MSSYSRLGLKAGLSSKSTNNTSTFKRPVMVRLGTETSCMLCEAFIGRPMSRPGNGSSFFTKPMRARYSLKDSLLPVPWLRFRRYSAYN